MAPSPGPEDLPPAPVTTPSIPQEPKKEAAVAPPLPTSPDAKPKTAPKTLKLTDLLKTDQKADEKAAAAEKVMNEPFTEQQLRQAWDEYAEQRRKFQAEFQMLSQPYVFKDNKHIVVTLLSPVHETMLANIKVELSAFLREKLKNTSIVISGQLAAAEDSKKVIYTNRDKFDYLAEKNPILKELKDRLGLDTDF